MTFPAKTFLIALGLASGVLGHGAIHWSEADGVRNPGYFERGRGYPDKNDHSLGNNWLTPEQIKALIFVSPEQYNTPDVICAIGATNAPGYMTVEAGHEITFQWTDWPFGHHGPMIDYLANCHGECTTVDKTSLRFNKIAEKGLLDPNHKLVDKSTGPGADQTSGYWGSDQFREQGSNWTVRVPSAIAPGLYVWRHETIALHDSMPTIKNGTQNYPQCFNLNITGSGTDTLSGGTPGMELYDWRDPGIFEVDIFAHKGRLQNYTIPGPPLYVFDGAGSTSAISTDATTATATPSYGMSSSAAKYLNTTSQTTPTTVVGAATTPTTIVEAATTPTAVVETATTTTAPAADATVAHDEPTSTDASPATATTTPSTDTVPYNFVEASSSGDSSDSGETTTIQASTLRDALAEIEALCDKVKATLGQATVGQAQVVRKERRHARHI